MDIWVIQLAGSRGLKFCAFLDFKYKGWWGCGEQFLSIWIYCLFLFVIFWASLSKVVLHKLQWNQFDEKKSCTNTLQKLSFWINMKWCETWEIPTKKNFISMSKKIVWAQSTAVKIVTNLSFLHFQDLKYRMCWK